MDAVIAVHNLSKVYQRGKQKVEVLHHVNLEVSKGDFVALMGPSGSGKTRVASVLRTDF